MKSLTPFVSQLAAAWGSTEDSEVLELRAITNIEAEAEVCVDYVGDRSFLLPRPERRRWVEARSCS